RQPTDNPLRLLYGNPPFAGRKDKAQSIGAGFNRAERVFKRGSPTDFYPGMHAMVFKESCFGCLLDCATPMWRSRGGWRIPSCILYELLQFLPGIFSAHQRFTNQKCLVPGRMQLADLRAGV